MTHAPASHYDTLADRFGLKITARLNEQPLPHDISERLRIARMQALSGIPKTRLQTAGSTIMSGGAAVLTGGASDDGLSRWNRFASALPLIALLAGLIAVNVMTDDDSARELADVDMQLLTDDLPPAAHTDAGFAQFLKFGPPQP